MKRILSTALVVLMVLAMVGQPVAATTPINHDADAAHNPYIDTDVTKSAHQMGWAPTEYEDDAGEVTSLPAEVNDSAENPYELTFSRIDASAYTDDFPANSGDTEWTNDSQWTTDATGSAGSISVSNGTVADGVTHLTVSTSSQTDTDTAYATYDGFDIESDAEKRIAQAVFDVNSLDAGTTAEIRFNDGTDGDYVAATIDTGVNASMAGNASSQTGDGFVYQQQVGDLSVEGSGDGTIDEINSVEVYVMDGNADISITGLGAERTDEWTLAEQRYDSDGDGELDDTRTLEEVTTPGPTAIESLDSMGGVFGDATINGLTVDMHFYASDATAQEDEAVQNATFEDADAYENFAYELQHDQRIHLPSAFDLSYANAELKDTVEVPSQRYMSVEYATDVGTTDFSNITFTEATSQYSTLDGDVSLADSGLSAGDTVAVSYQYLVTDNEHSALTDVSTGGGAPMESEGDGFFSNIWNTLLVIGGSILGFLGLRRAGGE